MSLPPSAPRRHLHTRSIECRGYEREDGLFDIEAGIIDRKTYAMKDHHRGLRPAGAHVHDMELRLTLDRTMTVRDIEVTTNDAPFPVCTSVAPGYKALIGARIGGGWRKAVAEAVGRTKGCTHVTELLMPAATVAFQTMVSRTAAPPSGGGTPHFIDGCKAWSSSGPEVKRLFPMYYKGPA